MPAARRRDPITIQRLKSSASIEPATGEMAVESESKWEDYLPCFGEVLVKGQREFTRAGIVDADVSHLVRIPLSVETAAITSQTIRGIRARQRSRRSSIDSNRGGCRALGFLDRPCRRPVSDPFPAAKRKFVPDFDWPFSWRSNRLTL